MGRCIISYQQVLRSVRRNITHYADEVFNCNHIKQSEFTTYGAPILGSQYTVNYFVCFIYCGWFKWNMGPRMMYAAIEAMSNKEMSSHKAFIDFIIFFSPTSSHKLKRLDTLFKWPQKHSIAKIFKNDFVQTQGVSSPFTNWQNIRKIQARCTRRDSG
jgi:hypothetical protein